MTEKAVILTVESVRTRASTNEALVTFSLPLENAGHVSEFMTMIGEQVAGAFAKVDKYTKAPSPKGDKSESWQQRLWLSSFLRSPVTWKSTGTDEAFLNYLRGQPCAFCNNYNLDESGRAGTEAAHVRRIANGAGVGIKPEYSAISLCRDHHRLQHNEGESALGDNEWWQKKRIQALRAWVWDTMKREIGVESMKQATKQDVWQWADEKKIAYLLPGEFL
jgi:hypothetical protein